MMEIKKILEYILAVPKSVIFNFKYLRFREAIKLPVIVSHRVHLKGLKGKITVMNPRPLGIRIGFGDVGIFDKRKSHTIWKVTGLGMITFKGKAFIGHGSKISVAGQLEIGHNFRNTAECSIVCEHKITIGEDVLISWDTLIMDTDYHHILLDNKVINHDDEIKIGNRVWIGCRCTVLKGSTVPAGSVIAANTVLTRKYQEENIIIGGNPSKILKTNIEWR